MHAWLSRWKTRDRKTRLGLLLFSSTLLLCICSILVLALVGDDDRNRYQADDVVTPPSQDHVAIEFETPVHARTGVTYAEILRQRATLPDVEWGPYARGLVGTRVEWAGYVAHTTPRGEVWVEMDPLAWPSEIPDVILTVSPQEVDLLARDDRITFTGTIRRISDYQGSVSLLLRDAALVW